MKEERNERAREPQANVVSEGERVGRAWVNEMSTGAQGSESERSEAEGTGCVMG